MAAKFSFHAPTRQHCHICESYSQDELGILDAHNAKASSASKFPVHNWFYFVLGYSPDFPDFLLDRENVNESTKVVDPFMGTGTTLIACKDRGITSGGIDANNYFYDVVKAKTNWNIDANKAEILFSDIINEYQKNILNFTDNDEVSSSENNQLDIFENKISFKAYATQHRPEMLVEKYLSDLPFVKLLLIKQAINKFVKEVDLLDFFNLAISSIIVPVSNVRYGPGFGVGKAKYDVDVLEHFTKKFQKMINDLNQKTPTQKSTKVDFHLGDAREISKYFEENSVDLMITSPPYPGDHEYTKHTRLELIFMDYANNLKEFRTIKQRMIRGSTTNIYKDDNDKEFVQKFDSIKKVVELIDFRLKEDNATSGFEKLYTRLVQEYFGGMYKQFLESYKILKPGGKYSLLVSDSHAFKMVHIETAKILAEMALDIGFSDTKIELWQSKKTTSHSYLLRENIVTLIK